MCVCNSAHVNVRGLAGISFLLLPRGPGLYSVSESEGKFLHPLSCLIGPSALSYKRGECVWQAKQHVRRLYLPWTLILLGILSELARVPPGSFINLTSEELVASTSSRRSAHFINVLCVSTTTHHKEAWCWFSNDLPVPLEHKVSIQTYCLVACIVDWVISSCSWSQGNGERSEAGALPAKSRSVWLSFMRQNMNKTPLFFYVILFENFMEGCCIYTISPFFSHLQIFPWVPFLLNSWVFFLRLLFCGCIQKTKPLPLLDWLTIF